MCSDTHRRIRRVLRPVFKLQELMPQIGFTHKSEEIYARFQDMRREYESQHGRTYAPDFLAVLMDAFNVINQLNSIREEWVKRNPKDTASFVIEPGENGEVQFWRIEEDAPGQERWTELLPPVSLRAYIADAEANDPKLKTGWAGTEPDEFLREHGYRTDLEPENETK